jgi:GPH family glycoside/pentoside/hexuronide:cation symporter
MEAEMEIFVLAAFLVGVLLSVPLWVILSRKFGNRKMYIWGCLLTAIALIPFLFVSELLIVVIFAFTLGICTGSVWTLMYPTFSDVIDEIVSKTGTRQEGTYFGIRTFIGRLSIVIQAIAFALVHELTNFRPGAETQTPLALFGIRIIMALIPILFFLIGFLLLWKFYDLTPERVNTIKSQIDKMNL